MRNDEDLKKGEKLKFYKDKYKPVHIELNNDQFYNGYVWDISSDFFLIDDFKIGETLVFFKEVKVIEPYAKK